MSELVSKQVAREHICVRARDVQMCRESVVRRCDPEMWPRAADGDQQERKCIFTNWMDVTARMNNHVGHGT
jgi:hypothetical protein